MVFLHYYLMCSRLKIDISLVRSITPSHIAGRSVEIVMVFIEYLRVSKICLVAFDHAEVLHNINYIKSLIISFSPPWNVYTQPDTSIVSMVCPIQVRVIKRVLQKNGLTILRDLAILVDFNLVSLISIHQCFFLRCRVFYSGRSDGIRYYFLSFLKILRCCLSPFQITDSGVSHITVLMMHEILLTILYCTSIAREYHFIDIVLILSTQHEISVFCRIKILVKDLCLELL